MGFLEPATAEGRRRHGLGTWRLVHYADDFVIMVNGTRSNVETVRDEAAAVLAPMGLNLSEGQDPDRAPGTGSTSLRLRIIWKNKRGSSKCYVYTFIADKPVQTLKRWSIH